jgi:hypothetical protein
MLLKIKDIGVSLMNYFNVTDIKQIQKGYEQYISDLKSVTFDQYKDIISDFLGNIVLGKIEKNNYKDFFSNESILEFRKMRKSLIVRSALNKLLLYLIENKLIEKGYEFEFSVDTHHKERSQNEFLSTDEIKFIFEEAEFENKEEKLISLAICSLACFCFFEQKHIKSLKTSDILIENGLIRNLRASDDDENTIHLIKWLRLNDIAYRNIFNYINEYRNYIDTQHEEFLIYEGKPLNNINDVNKFFYAFDRKVNREKISKVNVQLLYSSTLLYWLTSTHGNALNKILQIIEIGNQQWQKAKRMI